MLLLDEPTNDLDFDGLARLERFVAERPGGVVIVSHDRAFLERTVTRVLELDEIAHTAAEFGGRLGRLPGAARDRRAATPRSATRRTRPSATGSRTAGARSGSGRRRACARRRRRSNDEPDKNVRRAKTERSEKQAAKVRATERAIERLDAVDKPWAALGAAAALRRRRALAAT